MKEERTTPLRQRMIEDMRIRGMGDKAQKSHIRAIKDFAAFLGRSPDTATPEDLRAYQLHVPLLRRPHARDRDIPARPETPVTRPTEGPGSMMTRPIPQTIVMPAPATGGSADPACPVPSPRSSSPAKRSPTAPVSSPPMPRNGPSRRALRTRPQAETEPDNHPVRPFPIDTTSPPRLPPWEVFQRDPRSRPDEATRHGRIGKPSPDRTLVDQMDIAARLHRTNPSLRKRVQNLTEARRAQPLTISVEGLRTTANDVYTFIYPRSRVVIETRIRRVGNSAVMTLTTEMLTILDAKEGDTLFVMRGDDGSLKITPHDPGVAAALAAAEIVMDENRDLLQALA